MRKFFFILFFCFITSSLFSQSETADTTIIEQHELQNDTTIKKDVDEGINGDERDLMRNNLNSFLQMQEERKEKEKKRAFIRIGIGIAFLIVLIIGLSRRRKKAS